MSKCNCECHKEEPKFKVGDWVRVRKDYVDPDGIYNGIGRKKWEKDCIGKQGKIKVIDNKEYKIDTTGVWWLSEDMLEKVEEWTPQVGDEEVMKKKVERCCATCRFALTTCPDGKPPCREENNHRKWQPKEEVKKDTCPTCKQKLPIKQEYCCDPFRFGVELKTIVITHFFIDNSYCSKWTLEKLNSIGIVTCPFCGKHPIPPIKKELKAKAVKEALNGKS